MLIYIRHGDDRDDDPDHRHDRRLTDRGKRRASRLAKRLIKKYGHPEVVHVSPFRRTRETLQAMTERFTSPVIVHCDVRLAQYLSKKQQRAPDVSPDTASAGAPIFETSDEFDLRVKQHVEEMHRAGHHRSSGAIWCITHTIVVQRVAGYFNVNEPDDLDFLDHLVIG